MSSKPRRFPVPRRHGDVRIRVATGAVDGRDVEHFDVEHLVVEHLDVEHFDVEHLRQISRLCFWGR